MPDIELPVPGVTANPDWAPMLNAAVTAINSEVDGRLGPDQLSATIGGAVSGYQRASDVALVHHTKRIYRPYLERWDAALEAVRAGTRDAKLLALGDSTTAGVGGGTQSTFVQAASYPTFLADRLNDRMVRAAHGLACPPSYSSTTPGDSRWTRGTGWVWRSTDALNAFIGLGGKGMSARSATAGSVLTYADPRVLADRFDVYILVTDTGGADYEIQATGGTPVTGNTGGQSEKGIRRITVSASEPATTNSVSITRAGSGSNALYVVGVEPWLSTVRKVRVGNGGASGSNSLNWVTYPSGSAVNTWNSMAVIESYEPDLSIIDIGINDTDPANPTPLAEYQAAMETIIASAQQSGDVIIKTFTPSQNRQSTQAPILTWLRSLDLPLIDQNGYLVSYEAAAGRGFMADGLHPNEAGYGHIADFIFAALS